MANLFETLKARLPRLVSGNEILRIRETMRGLAAAYYEGPFQLPPDQLMGQLREYDSAVLGDLVNTLYWEQLGLGYSVGMAQARKRATDESHRLWLYSVLYQWAVWLWTNYGFGENVVVVAKDAKPEGELRELASLFETIRDRLPDLASKGELHRIQELERMLSEAYGAARSEGKIKEAEVLRYGEDYFREFWTASRNQPVLAADKLHNLSNRVLVDGNQFLSYSASTLDGATTVRKIKPSEIAEIVTDPEDASVPWFYKRQWSTKKNVSRTWYYPAWEIFFDPDLEKKASDVLSTSDVRADKTRVNEEGLGTAVCIQHIAHNCKEEDSLWGWPLAVAATPWLREHKRFRENRSAVAASRAMYTWKTKVKGGSRAVGSVQSQLASAFATGGTRETNPPPVAGSTWVENPAAVLEALSQKTGAGDAKEDGNALAWMGLLGLGVYPHYGGIGDILRWATAQMLEGPILRQWSRYQLFWSAQFRTMVRIVLKFREKYGGAGGVQGATFETYEAEVSTDRLVETDLAAITGAVGDFYEQVFVPLIDKGIVSRELAGAITARVLRIMLQALGVSDADDVAGDEAFERKEGETEEREFVSPEARAMVEAAERMIGRT